MDASLNPSQPFYKNVTWADLESGKILSLTPSGTNKQSCSVAVVYDRDGKSNPAWIQNIINADNSKKTADGGYQKLEGSGTHTEKVTATSEDQTHGVVTAECDVTINFRTDDQTVIHPEGVKLSKTALNYDLEYQYNGDLQSTVKAKTGFGVKDTLIATVLPDLEDNQGHKPYNRNVIWTSSDSDAVTVKDGKVTVNDQAKWIQEALKKAPYTAEKQVVITASTEDGQKEASCTITLKFKAYTVIADREKKPLKLF